jgi:predicted secreted hydrolase
MPVFLLALCLLLCAIPAMADEAASWPRADPGYQIRFPLDEGSHPAFASEWWYLTGWLETPEQQPLGFQVTFFRFRQKVDTAVPEPTPPAQVLVGHAALSDPRRGSALHDQRTTSAELGRAEARQGTMDVRIDDWSLRKEDEAYVALFPARDFGLDLRFTPTQPLILHGQRGFSQKAQDSTVASHYYSVPHLQVSGTVARQGRSTPVTGTAWLDREWFTAPSWIIAASWDWIGINLSDGGALMASRIRDNEGRPSWAFGSYRDAAGRLSVFGPGDIAFTPSRTWRSPRTDVIYPVEWRVRAGDLEVRIEPLMDDQEFDARESAETLYWEGAVRAHRNGKVVGRGYLELTGYGQPPK